jgi:tRNA(fMet)-specific endonuclease VapC
MKNVERTSRLRSVRIPTESAPCEADEPGDQGRERADQELCLSAITVAELRFGADKRNSRRIHRAIDAFLSGVDVLPFDATAAAKFGVVGSALATSGVPIGQMDTLIAAHALSVNATLVTNNERHFSKVAGLKVENWT